MPETTVQKMINAIAILTGLTKARPRNSIQGLVAKCGKSHAHDRAEQDRDEHCECLTSVAACPMEARMTRAIGIARICIITC